MNTDDLGRRARLMRWVRVALVVAVLTGTTAFAAGPVAGPADAGHQSGQAGEHWGHAG